ncbi:MAG: transporter [Chthoniobacteraceae bacterium]|nr:transporter [Chthoniobacteraceae bacterium]
MSSSDSTSNAIASASELVVKYGIQTVLDHATLTIHAGDRIGLVGRNGCGKSTFLKIAAGTLEPDAGQFSRRRDIITGYLPQVFDLDESANVHTNVLAGAQTALDLIAEYERIPAESARSAQVLDQIHHLDGWNLEHRIKSLITNLHAPDPGRNVATLSGGEKRRVALCRALLARPDLLILDEPTNHLDTGSIEWLEEFLSRYEGTCLFVTHDRYFLDRISTRIVELARGDFKSYEGNYSDFLVSKAEQQVVEEQQDHKREKFLKRELEWVRKRPRARRTKSVDRVERYFEMAAEEGPEAELDVELIIPPAPKLGNRVIELKEVGAAVGERVLFENLSLNLAAGERLGVVGRNGMGKSTLLKIILGEVAPLAGEVEIGPRTEINYVDQNRITLDETKTIYEEVGEGLEYVRLGEEDITLRGYLRRFLFSEDRIMTRIQLLSGGERSRVLLAKILKRGGNVLILDEPTNDLDLGTLRLLEEALIHFKGSVMVVSHDRYFLNRVCTAILAFEDDGGIDFHVGNYDRYLEKRAESVAREAALAKPVEAAAPVRATAEKPRKLKWKEERELEGMEANILIAEEEVSRLETLFAQADFYAAHGHEWHKYEAQLAAARHAVAKLYARWQELEKIRG